MKGRYVNYTVSSLTLLLLTKFVLNFVSNVIVSFPV